MKPADTGHPSVPPTFANARHEGFITELLNG